MWSSGPLQMSSVVLITVRALMSLIVTTPRPPRGAVLAGVAIFALEHSSECILRVVAQLHEVQQ